MVSAPTKKQIKCLSGCLLYFKIDELKKIKIKKYSSTKENSDIPNSNPVKQPRKGCQIKIFLS